MISVASLNFQCGSIRGIRLFINGANQAFWSGYLLHCCFRISSAFSAEDLIPLALLRSSSISLFVSSIIFPISMTFSVAVWVSVPERLLPWAISGNCLLHIIYGCRGMGCGFTHISRSIKYPPYYDLVIPFTTFTISCLICVKARAMEPVSSRRLPSNASFWSARKSISARLCTRFDNRTTWFINHVTITKYKRILNISMQ